MLCCREEQGVLMLKQQRRYVEAFQKLSITDSDSDSALDSALDSAPSSAPGSALSPESVSSTKSTKMPIPEAEKSEPSKMTVHVGNKRYDLDLSKGDKFDAKKVDSNGQKTIFEDKVLNDGWLPPRRPVFLGIDEDDECYSIKSRGSMSHPPSLASQCTNDGGGGKKGFASPATQRLSTLDSDEWSPDPMSNLSDPFLLDSPLRPLQDTTNTGNNSHISRHNSTSNSDVLQACTFNPVTGTLSSASFPAPTGPAPRPKKGREVLLQELLKRESTHTPATKEQLQLALSQIAVPPGYSNGDDSDDDDDDDDGGGGGLMGDMLAINNHTNCKCNWGFSRLSFSLAFICLSLFLSCFSHSCGCL
jgi:hypothetical protein